MRFAYEETVSEVCLVFTDASRPTVQDARRALANLDHGPDELHFASNDLDAYWNGRHDPFRMMVTRVIPSATASAKKLLLYAYATQSHVKPRKACSLESNKEEVVGWSDNPWFDWKGAKVDEIVIVERLLRAGSQPLTALGFGSKKYSIHLRQ